MQGICKATPVNKSITSYLIASARMKSRSVAFYFSFVSYIASYELCVKICMFFNNIELHKICYHFIATFSISF